MELTRRDAIAALSGAGIVLGSGAAALARETLPDSDPNLPSTDETVEALVLTAEVVYPSDVENVREFVEAFAVGRLRERPDHRQETRTALDDLNAHARIAFEADYASLSAADRETVLTEAGVDTAEPDPGGTTAERVRYYLVNDVLYALYTSPTGGELVGIENPQGHPGGTTTYRRGPNG
jgi:hypothetical protein